MPSIGIQSTLTPRFQASHLLLLTSSRLHISIHLNVQPQFPNGRMTISTWQPSMIITMADHRLRARAKESGPETGAERHHKTVLGEAQK